MCIAHCSRPDLNNQEFPAVPSPAQPLQALRPPGSHTLVPLCCPAEGAHTPAPPCCPAGGAHTPVPLWGPARGAHTPAPRAALQRHASRQALIYTSKTPTIHSHWARQKGI